MKVTPGKVMARQPVLEKNLNELLSILKLQGENFEDTAARVSNFWTDFLTGRGDYPRFTTFTTTNQEMVILKDIVVWGLCPHHLLPIRYTLKVGYVPNGYVLGISKVIRFINTAVKDLPLQEDFCGLVVEALKASLNPKGAACQIHGYHLCMAMRGVEKDATMVTTHLYGDFYKPEVRQEFLAS